MIPEDPNERTLRLLLRAEFADFRLSLFQELQVKLDTKADRLPFELLAKDVAELKASAQQRFHLGADVKSMNDRLVVIERAHEDAAARQRGIRSVLSVGKAVTLALFAAALAAFDVALRLLH